MLRSLGLRSGLALLVWMMSASAQAGFLKVENIVQCMRGNLVEGGAMRPLTATTRRPDGGLRETGIQLSWRAVDGGDLELNLQVVSPADLNGIAYLLKPTDAGVKAWLYLPAMESVREISADELTEALWGTEFSYAQFRQLLGDLLGGEARRQADQVLAEREVYVIDTRPARRSSRHATVRSFIDKESCLLIRAEYLDGEGELQQVLEADPATLSGRQLESKEVWLISDYQMRNRASGQTTRLQAGDIRLLGAQASKLFSPRHFHEPLAAPAAAEQ